MIEEMIYFNGVDAVTGGYLVPPMDYSIASNLIRSAQTDKQTESWLRRIGRIISEVHLGLPFDINPEIVEQAGWAIVFHEKEGPAVKQAFEPLIAHRRKQIANGNIVKELEYREGEERASWLARHGVGSGSIYPDKIPY